MPKRLRPAYVVEHDGGEKYYFKTKKEICDKYNMKLGWVNKAIIFYPLKIKESPVWIRDFSCKNDCDNYMIKDCTCPWYKNRVKALRSKRIHDRAK